MHANLPLALLSPLVPSVLSRVRAEMGPTFWKHRRKNGKWGLMERSVATTDTLRSCRARVLPVATLAPNARPLLERADATMEGRGVVHLLASPLTATPVPTHPGS